MRIWFTSDMHFNHTNIIKYCERPFHTIDKMNEVLIRNWNDRVKKEDIVYHLGDFCFYRGKEAAGSKTSVREWESKLNGKVIHVLGNHDSHNSMMEQNLRIVTKFGNKLILMTHIPPKETDNLEPYDLVLCGHVHEKWDHTWINGKLVINVGCDVHKFMPINKNEIMRLVYKYEKERIKCTD